MGLTNSPLKDQANRSARSLPFPPIAACVVTLALIPYPGRWKLLQQILPLAVIALFYWRPDYSLRRVGLGKPPQGWPHCLAQASGLVLALQLFQRLALRPTLLGVFGQGKDLSLFDPLKGSLPTLVLYLTFMWILAAFGEEFLWRGFLLREMGERNLVPAPWLFAVVLSAAFFALAHAYQGPFGVVEKFILAVLVGAIYVWSGRQSIWLVVLIHGTGNTISFVRIYLQG